jgi:hypothetical protein
MSLINQNSTTNYWWDCPSCGQTKISSVLHETEDFSSEIIGARLQCPECFYVIRGNGTEHEYVDNSVYSIPTDKIELLQTPRWKCQECGGLNLLDDNIDRFNLTVDDLCCSHCETWQCDIPGSPNYDANAKVRRESIVVEEKSRWENPIIPIELKDDYAKFESNYEYSPSDIEKPSFTLSLPKIGRRTWIISGVLALSLGLGGFIFDGVRPRTVEAEISQPQVQTSQTVEQYSIVTKEGWSPNYSAPDFRIVNQESRQNGTREVPDGVETYFETERYIARYDTETYTTTQTEQVQSGTRQDCQSVKVGATVENRCSTVPVYTTKSTPVTQTREVPVYDTREVPKTRTKYRTEPVYDTYYVWQQGVWNHYQTFSESSNTFEIKYPKVPSEFGSSSEYRVLPVRSNCSILLTPEAENLQEQIQRKNIDCGTFSQLSENEVAEFRYSKFFGISEVNIHE